MTNKIYEHHEQPHSLVKIVLVDLFTSAFDTIQPHLLVGKLRDFEINPRLWINDFLLNRTQQVRVNTAISDTVHQ